MLEYQILDAEVSSCIIIPSPRHVIRIIPIIPNSMRKQKGCHHQDSTC